MISDISKNAISIHNDEHWSSQKNRFRMCLQLSSQLSIPTQFYDFNNLTIQLNFA